MAPLLETARPRQWAKNLFVLAPVVFAKHLGDGVAVARALAAFTIFCGLSSATYLYNDVVDVERDRAHPRKRERPIASGRLSAERAKLAAACLVVVGLGAAALLDLRFAAVGAFYFVFMTAYSLRLKHIAYLDVSSIAVGFLLRVLAGALAVRVESSPYLLVCTALVALYSALGKRAHELKQVGAGDGAQRPTLKGYHLPSLRLALYLVGVATFLSYVAYTRAEHTLRFFQTDRMWWTLPFCLFGLGRFLWLALYRPRADSPTEEMMRDPPFLANLLAWGLSTTLIIYYR
jgi:4-hydroxybenzoate polyprenyltransferase